MNVNRLNLCRICLENGANIPLFENSELVYCNILSKLMLCLNEKVEDIEGYPRFICNNCSDTIETLYGFINKYRQTCSILINDLEAIKTENYDSDQGLALEIGLEYIKQELESENQQLELPLIQLDVRDELQIDNSNKSNCPKQSTIKDDSKHNNTNIIASSILEGDFAWVGDVWRMKSPSPNLNEKNMKEDKPPRQRQLKIIKQKKRKKPKESPTRLCDICGEIFKDQDKLSMHKKKVHFNKAMKCPKCPRVIVSQYYLDRHLKRCHDAQARNIICPTCGCGFAFKGELGTHIRNVHNKHLKPKKTYSCNICGKIYKCAKSVVVHVRSVHTGQRPAICEVCGTSFYHDEYLREHMRLHTGETPYKCPICGRGYAQRCNMKSHLRVHRISELDASTLSKLRPTYLKLLRL